MDAPSLRGRVTARKKRVGRPRLPGKATTASHRLYPDDVARLQRLAERMRVSESAVIREALQKLEDSLC
jgi:hypothetical protein